jgi:DNA-binding MarR family transcriptional regulator
MASVHYRCGKRRWMAKEIEQDLGEGEGPSRSSGENLLAFDPTPSQGLPGPSDGPAGEPDLGDAGAVKHAEPLEGGSPPTFLKRAAPVVVDAEESPPADPGLPPAPSTLAELGLSKAFLSDLALKMIHYAGTQSASQLANRMGLGRPIVEQILTSLSGERLLEVQSRSDVYTGNYRYRLSEKGTRQAAEALERTRYAGPTPVTAEQYIEVMGRMGGWQAPSRVFIKEVLNRLVLSGPVADAAARALHSGKSALLYGPSGNGKSSILGQFARNLGGLTLVPYAVYAHGQVIRIFDQSIHKQPQKADSGGAADSEQPLDGRWTLVRRPAIVLGAELGPEALDLSFDPKSNFYQAPPHIKAQGGVLFVDDFGRQKIDARDLLTRWLISLERGWDSLSLVTGERVTVPFKAQLLLATNLNVEELADDALLRRILYKVEIPNPRPQDFAEIMRRTCYERQILVADGALDYVLERLYNQSGPEPHASQARDLADMIVESAAFDGKDPVLSRESFDKVLRLFESHQ